jgi:hypothetical protein
VSTVFTSIVDPSLPAEWIVLPCNQGEEHFEDGADGFDAETGHGPFATPEDAQRWADQVPGTEYVLVRLIRQQAASV